VWLGKLPLRTALRDGSVTVQATPSVRRRLPDVLELSPIAPAVADAFSGSGRRSAAVASRSASEAPVN
jgi:hypothetical protein